MSDNTLTFRAYNASDLRQAFVACLKAVGKDVTIPILTGVHARRDGDQLVLTATDRYRMVRVRVTGEWTGEGDLAAVLTAQAVTLIVKSATAPAARRANFGEIVFTPTDGNGSMLESLTFTLTGESRQSVTDPTLFGDYPRVDSIVDNARTSVAKAAFGVNPKYLADLCASIPDRAAVIRHGGPKGEFVVAEWEGDGAEPTTFMHLLMTVRDERATALNDAA